MKYLKFVFLILCISVVSCAQMNDDTGTIDEPASESTGFINTVKKDGVRFSLSLLNEQGNPAVTFREGENIIFHFKMENVRKDDKRHYVEDLMVGMFRGGFCDVYTRNGDLLISLFQRHALCETIFVALPFDGENRMTVSLPLYDDREEWPHGHCGYRRNNPSVLPKGSYSTGFTYTFRYYTKEWDEKDINSIPTLTWVEVGPITMNIDFTIE